MSTQFWLAIVGWIIIAIIWLLVQHSMKRMGRKSPKYIEDLFSELPAGWSVASYQWKDLDFDADLSFGERIFRISAQDGKIFAYAVVNEKLCALPPSQYMRDTLLEKSMAERLIEAANNFSPTPNLPVQQ